MHSKIKNHSYLGPISDLLPQFRWLVTRCLSCFEYDDVSRNKEFNVKLRDLLKNKESYTDRTGAIDEEESETEKVQKMREAIKNEQAMENATTIDEQTLIAYLRDNKGDVNEQVSWLVNACLSCFDYDDVSRNKEFNVKLRDLLRSKES